MADADLQVRETPTCPLLGLAFDRGSHYAFPDPGHRCFAGSRLAAVDVSRQATCCLSGRYGECDRFRVSEHPDAAGDPSKPPVAAEAPIPARGSASSTAPAQVTADFSPRRRLWRDAAALLFVVVLGVFLYSLVEMHGSASEGGVLVAPSPTGSLQATGTAVQSVTPTDTPTPLPSPTPSPSPTATPTPSPSPTRQPTPQPTVRPTSRPSPLPTPTPNPSPILITPPPVIHSPSPTQTPAP
jgi:hypothetical protein